MSEELLLPNQEKCSTCMKLSLVAIPSCLSKLIKELAFSLSSSLLSSDRMITLLNISGRKCLGALISLTPLTASFAFPLFKYSVTTVSWKEYNPITVCIFSISNIQQELKIIYGTIGCLQLV